MVKGLLAARLHFDIMGRDRSTRCVAWRGRTVRSVRSRGRIASRIHVFNSSIITTPSLSTWRWQSAATAALPCQTLPSIMTMKSSRPKRRTSAESWRVPNARWESREVLRFGRLLSLPPRTQTWVMRGRSLVAQQKFAVFIFFHGDTKRLASSHLHYFCSLLRVKHHDAFLHPGLAAPP